MGLFGFGKKRGIVDLGEHYRQKKEKEAETVSSESNSSDSNGFALLDSVNNNISSENSGEVLDLSSGEERRRKLVKRISEMTSKLEDLSNQIYHLQQRIEVIEKKMNVNKY